MKKVLALFLAVLFVLTPVAVSAETIYGDVDGNGKVTSADVATLARHIAQWTGYETVDETIADVNGDGSVTPLDSIILTRHWAGWSAYATLPYAGEVKGVLDENITVRSDLSNVYNKLTTGEEVVVTYLGGSVTYGFGTSTPEQTSWRALTYNWLTTNFPNANLKQNNVAIGGTGSHLGAFRTQVDVIDKNTDLLFVEFCVNDSYCGTAKEGLATFYYEQIVRQVRENLPECQIISIFTRDFYSVATKGKTSVARMHDAVCEKYGITSIDVGHELSQALGYSSADWDLYFDNNDVVHPADGGYKVYGDLIIKYLSEYLANEDIVSEYSNEIVNYTMPVGYADTRNATAKLETVQLKTKDVLYSSKGIGVDSSTKHNASNLTGYIYPTSADNEVVFKFTGTAVDLFANAQYIEYSIDGGSAVTQQIVSRDDGVFPLIDGLKPTEHTLKIKFLGKTGTGDISSSNMIKAFLVRGIKD